ncbi:hypothetical protein BCAR13_1380007 [Paraburkholderia caribensis]|nr:hypothetical protein BCAR13_1380007 [Paraburkholderia caribensis]
MHIHVRTIRKSHEDVIVVNASTNDGGYLTTKGMATSHFPI